MKGKNFIKVVERTEELYNKKFSNNIKACAVYAIDDVIGAKIFAQTSNIFQITKSEYADKIIYAIQQKNKKLEDV